MEKRQFQYHAISYKEVIKKLLSDEKGLPTAEAELRLEKYGPNQLPEKKPVSPLLIFLKQFNSFFIYILIIAGAISFFVKNFIDAYVIAAVIIINSSIGFFQEYKAERAIKALKQMIVPYAKVYRDSALQKIPAKNLVPGDIILLEEGDLIPADARLIEIKNFVTIEASLTGESFPVNKKLAPFKEDTSLADRGNMVWMGTFVAAGTAKAIIVETGAATAIGSIAQDIEQIKPKKSHFQKKVDFLALQMGSIALVGALIIFAIGFFINRFPFVEILLFTIASLVAGIPEGLPAVLIIVLAIGAFRMAKRKAIIRKLPSTETLAVIDTIITDKTGTLTENTMSVQKILLSGEDEIIVSGDGWAPIGNFSQKNALISPLENNQLSKLLHIAAICNNAKLIKESSVQNGQDIYKIIGDPTEAALVALAEKAALKREMIEAKEKKLDDLPFNQELKYRASLSHSIKEKKKQIYVVGAPESVLKQSSHILKLKTSKKLTQLEKDLISKQINSLSNKAMRVLALAYKEIPSNTKNLSETKIENLIFVGLVGIKDPLRAEVKEAISRAKKAGIRIIMATGDHKNTALAVAKEIGLSDESSSNHPKVLTEEELKSLNAKEFENAVKNVNVFARLTPHMKLKIADILQKSGNIVAMTGDGVNDAPALKKADIGISMGIIGTDVARESSEIVLADDNFASIINAIEEGRIVFTNTRQTSFFLVTTNFAEHFTIIATLALGLPLPLLPTQILWLNIVTDTGPGLGLAAEPGHNHLAEEKPRNPKENILSKEILPFLLVMVATMTILAIAVFMLFLQESLSKARTGAFVVMALTQLYNSLNMRSLKKSIFKIGLFSNKYLSIFIAASIILLLLVVYIPFMQNIFRFTSLSLIEFMTLFFLCSFVLWAGELYKKVKNRKA